MLVSTVLSASVLVYLQPRFNVRAKIDLWAIYLLLLPGFSMAAGAKQKYKDILVRSMLISDSDSQVLALLHGRLPYVSAASKQSFRLLRT